VGIGSAFLAYDCVAITPIEQAVTAEAAVAAKDDAHFRPDLAQPLDQQRQDCPGMLGAVDVAGAQVVHQQLLTAEDIQSSVNKASPR
jgi:hypothetical protein